jgi:type IV pilus assembly protein PilM
MLEFLNKPITLKRSPSRGEAAAAGTAAPATLAAVPQPVVTALTEVPEDLVATKPAAPAAVQQPAELSTAVRAPRRGRGGPRVSAPSLPSLGFLNKPISLGRRPADAAAPAQAPASPAELVPSTGVAVAALAAVEPTAVVQDDPIATKGRRTLTVPRLSSNVSWNPRGAFASGRRTHNLVGLEIEPGQLIAVQSRITAGKVVVEHAVGRPIPPSIVRDGEVSDVDGLTAALADLFDGSGLDRRVRIGIANQRIVMRQIELPAITDPKELDSAVHFQAQDEIPMPIDSVVLDYHSLGISETEAGPRMAVLLVAARRDMVERMLLAARHAGLRPEGVDLAAFGMIRALRPLDAAAGEQVLYLSIGGLTNLAIASGSTCQFTRVITTGIETVVGEVAASAGVPLGDARRLVGAAAAIDAGLPSHKALARVDTLSPAIGDQIEIARTGLADGVRRIAAEVRNSLDFHRASRNEQPVSRAVLTGPVLDLIGFDTALARELDLPLTRGAVELASPGAAGHVPMSRLAVAAGLSVAEGPL